MRAWYLVFTKPRQERKALENLERQRYEAWLPLMCVRRRRTGRLAERVEPMFPRYLFIRLDDEHDDWGPVRSTLGVANMVRFSGRAARVPDDLVEAIRARCDGQGVWRVPERELRAGDPVRIEEGPFAGYEAIFKASTSRERVVVLLTIAGRETPVNIGRAEIEPLATR